IDPPSVSGAGLYRVSQRINEDGTYSGTLVYELGTGGGNHTFRSLYSKLSNDYTRLYKDSNTPVSDQGGVDTGYIYRVNNTLNDDGTYDARLVYESSQNAERTFSAEESPLGYIY
ncbi:MAG: hypothetical protein GWO08_13975, partial [Gammaproteobacteria bacterium]|nr:hypothetical protein [Phycisphaerae bacterium]NIQ74518.1 hypothetical protein [Gammaproteobacteria bacterium]NIR94731.1 hypothetical protein [Gammaproteobacteria bacterium]NIW99956.1 hypothetical protein [Phycisphaerae bacterium]